jgi:hypothetical protein
MSTTLFARHHVNDYSTWRPVYDAAETIRSRYGVTSKRVFRDPKDPNELLITHEFPTLEKAQSFLNDPALAEAMKKAGVTGQPRFELFTPLQ